MHKPSFLAAALLLTGAAGLALAQPAPAPEAGGPIAPPAGPGPQAQAPMPPGPGPAGPGFGPRGPRGPEMDRMRGFPHRPPPPSRAASFHLQREDSVIHIRCAENEPTRACVDAAAVLLDKVAGLPTR